VVLCPTVIRLFDEQGLNDIILESCAIDRRRQPRSVVIYGIDARGLPNSQPDRGDNPKDERT